MNHVDRRGLLHAAIYGAVTVTVAYLVAHGSIVAFVGVMVAFGIVIRVWRFGIADDTGSRYGVHAAVDGGTFTAARSQ